MVGSPVLPFSSRTGRRRKSLCGSSLVTGEFPRCRVADDSDRGGCRDQARPGSRRLAAPTTGQYKRAELPRPRVARFPSDRAVVWNPVLTGFSQPIISQRMLRAETLGGERSFAVSAARPASGLKVTPFQLLTVSG
jgi:hypothetical protein